MRRDLIGLTVAACLSVAPLVTTGAGAASAQAAPSDCPQNSVCVWEQPGFQGPRTDFAAPIGCRTPMSAFLSIKNKTSRSLLAYEGDDCSGKSIAPIEPGQEHPNLPRPALSFG